MKLIVLTAAAVLLTGSAFAQTFVPFVAPTNPFGDPRNTVGAAASQGLSGLAITGEVRSIPIFNAPNGGVSTIQSKGLNLLFSINPRP